MLWCVIAAFIATNIESLIGATLQTRFLWLTNELVNVINNGYRCDRGYTVRSPLVFQLKLSDKKIFQRISMLKWRFCALSLLLLLITACGTENQSNSSSNTASSPDAGRLQTVKNRGKLICGINGEVSGFSFVNEKGEYSGLDVQICRAIAAALFDDPSKVEYRKLSPQEDLLPYRREKWIFLSRNTTWTINRDTALGMEFITPVFYDGQGIMATKASNIKKLEDLSGKSICVYREPPQNKIWPMPWQKREFKVIKQIVSDDVEALYTAYQAGRCQARSPPHRSQLGARRLGFSPTAGSSIIRSGNI
ncbi:MAG UNVERIFIED_CONTAM: transporter substrate-binding domain-containing protein [Microcystis novacekii LVE1205-3]